MSVLESYNPTTNAWTPRAPMPTARAGVTSGVVNGILYVIGGNNGPGQLNVVEAYDPVSNTWSVKAPVIGGYVLPSTPQSLVGIYTP